MIDGRRRGYQIGRELAKVFGVAMPREQVYGYALDTLNFLQKAGFAHLDPDFVESFVEGWYEHRENELSHGDKATSRTH